MMHLLYPSPSFWKFLKNKKQKTAFLKNLAQERQLSPEMVAGLLPFLPTLFSELVIK